VEIGGGYGGLCFAIHFFSKKYDIQISNYRIIDLDEPLKLQQMYLKNFPLSFQVSSEKAETFGQNIHSKDLFLISTYCFSEIHIDLQTQYRNILFPKVGHGFIIWNHIPFYNFGFECRLENEEPCTAHLNKFIYF
jgi:hypothetical protein